MLMKIVQDGKQLSGKLVGVHWVMEIVRIRLQEISQREAVDIFLHDIHIAVLLSQLKIAWNGRMIEREASLKLLSEQHAVVHVAGILRLDFLYEHELSVVTRQESIARSPLPKQLPWLPGRGRCVAERRIVFHERNLMDNMPPTLPAVKLPNSLPSRMTRVANKG